MKKQPIPGSLRLWQQVVFLIAPVLCALVCLCIGRMNVPVRDLVSLLLGREVGAQARAVLWSMRLPRVLLAGFVSAVTRPFGVKGLFYKICGHGVAGIDGFYFRSSFDRYKTLALINPEHPVELSNEIEKECGIPIVIMDANDIDQNQLGKCDDFPLTDDQIQDAMKDNPSGQGGELTPLILIRPLA